MVFDAELTHEEIVGRVASAGKSLGFDADPMAFNERELTGFAATLVGYRGKRLPLGEPAPEGGFDSRSEGDKAVGLKLEGFCEKFARAVGARIVGFVGAAAESVPISAKESIAGKTLVEKSLAGAKAMTAALLGSGPVEAALKDDEWGVWVLAHDASKVCRAVKSDAFASAYPEGNAGAAPELRDHAPLLGKPNIYGVEVAVKKSLPSATWASLESCLAGESSEAAQWSPLGQADAVHAFESVRDTGGFAYVSCGPAGGVASGARRAREVEAACRELGRVLGLDSRMAGLDHLGLSLNRSRNESALGSYWKWNAVIEVGKSGLGVFGHEWTHALEHVCEKMKRIDPKWSLSAKRLHELRHAQRRSKQDVALAESHMSRLDGMGAVGMMEAFLEVRARGISTREQATEGARPLAKKVEALIEAFGGPRLAAAHVEKMLDGLCDPEKEPLATRGEDMAVYLARFKRESELVASFARG